MRLLPGSRCECLIFVNFVFLCFCECIVYLVACEIYGYVNSFTGLLSEILSPAVALS